MIPAVAADEVPPVGISRELARVLGMDAAVVLGRDAPARVREVEFGNRRSPLVVQDPIHLGFRKTRPHEKQAKMRLSRRANTPSRVCERPPEDSSTNVPHRLDLGDELFVRRDLRPPPIAEEELGRRDEVVQPPQGACLPPRPYRMLDRQAVGENKRRRLAPLQSVTPDPGSPRLPCRTVRGHMHFWPKGPLRHRRSDQAERGLVTEELPRCQSGRVVEARLQERRVRYTADRANAMEWPTDVTARQSRWRDAEGHRIGNAESSGQFRRKRRAARHPHTIAPWGLRSGSTARSVEPSARGGTLGGAAAGRRPHRMSRSPPLSGPYADEMGT